MELWLFEIELLMEGIVLVGKYQRKNCEEAVRFTESNLSSILEWGQGRIRHLAKDDPFSSIANHLEISNSYGYVFARIGEWIMLGGDNDFVVMSHERFGKEFFRVE